MEAGPLPSEQTPLSPGIHAPLGPHRFSFVNLCPRGCRVSCDSCVNTSVDTFPDVGSPSPLKSGLCVSPPWGHSYVQRAIPWMEGWTHGGRAVRGCWCEKRLAGGRALGMPPRRIRMPAFSTWRRLLGWQNPNEQSSPFLAPDSDLILPRLPHSSPTSSEKLLNNSAPTELSLRLQSLCHGEILSLAPWGWFPLGAGVTPQGAGPRAVC